MSSNKGQKRVIDKKICVYLAVMFFISIAIKSVISIKYSDMSVFPDEVLHWKISQAINNNGKVIFRNFNIGYLEVLYSIIISIVFNFTDNTFVAYNIAKVVNSILVSSVVFPVYMLTFRRLKSKNKAILVAFISIIIPESMYTLKIMQENLYYPIFMWFWFFLVLLFENNKISNSIILGTIVFIMTICKQMGLNVFVGMVLYFIIALCIYKSERKRTFINFIVFLISFIVLKQVYDNLFFTINNVQETLSENTVVNILNNIKDVKIIAKLLYPGFMYLAMTILAFGIFPVIIPIAFFYKLEKTDQKIIIVALSIIISTIGVICLQIIPDEGLVNEIIRIHYRYLYYMFIPFMILFLGCKSKLDEDGLNLNAILLLISFCVTISLGYVLLKYVSVDAPTLTIISNISKIEIYNTAVKMVILIGVLWISYCAYLKKVNIFYIIIISIICINGVTNTVVYCKNEFEGRKNFTESRDDAAKLNQFFKKNDLNEKSIVILSENNFADANLECYLYNNYNVAIYDEFVNGIIENGNEFKSIRFVSFGNISNDVQTKEPTYIISKKKIDINGYKLVDLFLKNYYLYKRDSSEIYVKYTFNGIYDDNWIEKESNFRIFDKNPKSTQKTVQLTMQSPQFAENNIKVTDSNGNETSICLTNEKKVYDVILNRGDNEEFVAKIEAEKTFNPEGSDERNLSVKIFDVKVYE